MSLSVPDRIQQYVQKLTEFKRAVKQKERSQGEELCSVLYLLTEWIVADMAPEQMDDGFEIANSGRFLSQWKAGRIDESEVLNTLQSWIEKIQSLESASLGSKFDSKAAHKNNT